MAAAQLWRLYITNASGGAGWAAFGEIIGIETNGGPNVITGGTATANQNYPGFPAPQGADGNLNTFYIAAPGGGGWPVIWQYDLGAGVTKDIKQITLTPRTDGWHAQNPTDFLWQYSTDGGATWNTEFAVAGGPVATGPSDSHSYGILPTVMEAGQLAVIGVEQPPLANMQIGQLAVIALLEGPAIYYSLKTPFVLPCWQPCTAFGTRAKVLRLN